MNTRVVPLLLLAACGGTGTWKIETWGEEYIEDSIPAADFEDGCEAIFTSFAVTITEGALVDGDGSDVAALAAPVDVELIDVGPHALAELDAPAGHYDEVRFTIDGVIAYGQLTCGGLARSFDWTFDTVTTYHCEPEDLTLASGGTATTQLTVHGDHLFYDGLSNEDAVVRGQALFDADADEDGAITQAELAAVPVAGLGYQVGPYAEVTDLGAFVRFLTQTLGHVDGEGHCQVNL